GSITRSSTSCSRSCERSHSPPTSSPTRRSSDLLVVTLGTLYVYRGIALTWAGSDRIDAGDMPRTFLRLGTQQVLGVPVLTVVAAVVLAAVAHYLHTARGGRQLYAIGSDPDAAALAGLPVRRRLLGAFALGGALAGLAGVMFAARYGTV